MSPVQRFGWQSGPPPHVGWWNASTEKLWQVWRWWNGHAWSKQARDDMPAQHAAICAMRLESEPHQSTMLWCDYWPPNGRVLRINPETGETTGNILTPGARRILQC